MAHAQKPVFVFRLNGTSPFKSAEEPVQSTADSRGLRISGSNAGYTIFGGIWRVLTTHSIRQFPLHFPIPCVTVCHHIPNAVYHQHNINTGYHLSFLCRRHSSAHLPALQVSSLVSHFSNLKTRNSHIIEIEWNLFVPEKFCKSVLQEPGSVDISVTSFL